MNWTLVTGAAKGLGAAICLELAKKEYSLIIQYNNNFRIAQDLQKKCLAFTKNVEVVQGNFSTRESLIEFVNKISRDFSQIKNLINNVGNYLVKPPLETSLDEWLALFQTNLHAPFLLSQSCSQSIKERKGSIVNIGVSGLNSFKANIYNSAYFLTKSALLGLTKTLAKELAPHEVTVNMVSPGYLENSVDFPKSLSSLPTGRITTLAEVVEIIIFLLSEKSRHITGQNIEVSGGVGL